MDLNIINAGARLILALARSFDLSLDDPFPQNLLHLD